MPTAQAECLEAALAEGHGLLMAGSPAVSVVEEAIRRLEDSGLFNAGRGSNRQLDGVCRMDASIMEGYELRAGAVASIFDLVRDPRLNHRVEVTGGVLAEEGAELLRSFFAGVVLGPIQVYELPRIQSLQVVLHDALGGGATQTLRFDETGKSMAALMSRMQIPTALLTKGEAG